jgi:hypothetical protein
MKTKKQEEQNEETEEAFNRFSDEFSIFHSVKKKRSTTPIYNHRQNN